MIIQLKKKIALMLTKQKGCGFKDGLQKIPRYDSFVFYEMIEEVYAWEFE